MLRKGETNMTDDKFDSLKPAEKFRYIRESLAENWPLSAHKSRWLMAQVDEEEARFDNVLDELLEAKPMIDGEYHE
jgi:hypothetical protein